MTLEPFDPIHLHLFKKKINYNRWCTAIHVQIYIQSTHILERFTIRLHVTCSVSSSNKKIQQISKQTALLLEIQKMANYSRYRHV